MPRLSRKLRVCKWLGTVGCLLLGVAFVGSQCAALTYVRMRTGQDAYGFWLDLGTAEFGYALMPACTSGWQLSRRPKFGSSFLDMPLLPSIQRTIAKGNLLPFYQASEGMPPPPSVPGKFPRYYLVCLPLWLPMLALLIPTLLLWRRDRCKPRPGHCRRCDYDLTGNVSGRCPECGLEIDPPIRPTANS